MVIGDWSTSEKVTPPAEAPPAWKDADPFDRFAAQAFDLFVVLVPLCGLAVAPIHLKISELYLVGEWTELTLLAGLAALVTGFIFCLYSGVTTFMWGQTFGKKMMRLKVIDLWTSKPPSLWAACARSFYLMMQFVLLGFPLFAILTNQRHRGVHDQLTDTRVVSISGKDPMPYKVWHVRAFMRFAVGLALVLTVPVGLKVGVAFIKTLDLDQLFSHSFSKGADCGNITSLEEGMSLVATGEESIKCLKSLVDEEFIVGGNPSALAYLVKSFLHVEDAELSDAYLDKVCRIESASPACLLSQVINAWSEGDLKEIETVLENSRDLEEPYLDLWALRYFQQAGHFERSLSLTDRLLEFPYLRGYVLSEKARAQYLSGRTSQAESVVRELRDNDPESTFAQEMISWSCQKKIDQSCGEASAEFCRDLQDLKAPKEGQNPLVLLGQLKLKECGGESVSLTTFLGDEQPTYWREFLYGVRKAQRGDFKSSWSIWKNVVNDGDAPDYLKAEALRRMLLHPEISEVESMSVLLGTIESFEYRNSSTRLVAEVYRKLDLPDLADALPGETSGERRPASLKGSDE